MKDILVSLLYVSLISSCLLLLASWYSIGLLHAIGSAAGRFTAWLQLRIKARIAGLYAYRAAVRGVLQENVIVMEERAQ